jgi:hypothetical protein
VTNIPAGDSKPPKDEPWIYYMLARLVVTRETATYRYKYVEVIKGETRDAVDESLLELITRPGVRWLEP